MEWKELLASKKKKNPKKQPHSLSDHERGRKKKLRAGRFTRQRGEVDDIKLAEKGMAGELRGSGLKETYCTKKGGGKVSERSMIDIREEKKSLGE